MGGSGYRHSRDTVAALYGAVRDWPKLPVNRSTISGPLGNGKPRVSICRGIPKNDPGTNLRLSLANRRH